MKKSGILHQECVKSAWIVQQLEQQINTMYYQQLLGQSG